MWLRITGAYDRKEFCTAVRFKGWRVAEAAPILRWLLGWSRSRVLEECARRGWKTEAINGGEV